MLANEVLARTIWGEARGEGLVGMHAICSVILNRAAAPCWWGKDIESVCLCRKQFSCWNDNDLNRAKLMRVGDEDPQFRIAKEIARNAIMDYLPDITNGATHYYRPLPNMPPPKWVMGMKQVATIDHHVFFKEERRG